MIGNVVLPLSGMTVSEICLGTANFGWVTEEDEAFRQMDLYVERGGRFFNTAHEYTSEPIIGRWLKSRGMRSELTICSKGGENRNNPSWIAMHGNELIESCESSLERLGIDQLDLYVLHLDDETVPVEEIVDALGELKRRGRFRFCGSSNWREDRVRAALAYARKTGQPEFAVNEIEWSLARLNTPNGKTHCLWLDEAYKSFARETNIPVMAYSPQASGAFSKMMSGAPLNDHQRNQYVNDYNLAAAKRLSDMAARKRTSISALAVAYTLRAGDFARVPIVGARTVKQLTESLEAVNISLTPQEIAELEGANA